MCGIFGYIGAKGADMAKISILGQMNDDRGGHASGIYSDTTDVVKATCLAASLLSNKKLLKQSPSVLIGHTRMATHGANIKQNAHPFKVGKIVGAHNGVISNYKTVSKSYGFETHAVDSVAIFQALSTSPKEGWPEIIPDLHGSMAISVVSEDGLSLYRRDNPIYTGSGDGGVYYSSISSSLKKIGCSGIESLPLDTIVTYNKRGIESMIDVPEYKGYAASWEDFRSSDVSYLEDQDLIEIIEAELSLTGLEAFNELLNRYAQVYY